MTKFSNSDDDIHLFRSLMKGVQPIKKGLKSIIYKEPPAPLKISAKPLKPKLEPSTQDNLDKVPYSLEKKLKKHKPFQPGVTLNVSNDYDEQITSASILAHGLESLSQQHRDRLTKGLLHIDARIDLHGLERFEAQDRLNKFIHHARGHANRTLLVIHGKGSKHGETPILKQHLFLWLRQYPHVLAIHSAHPKHGGTGAIYVVLKKSELKKNLNTS
jgi:DNA-nicking Smr family endonuclease